MTGLLGCPGVVSGDQKRMVKQDHLGLVNHVMLTVDRGLSVPCENPLWNLVHLSNFQVVNLKLSEVLHHKMNSG